MTIKPTDKVIFVVYHLDDNNKMVQHKHISFASAAGQAGALDGITRFIDCRVEWYTEQGEFIGSHSSTMYKYSRLDNQRTACNPTTIKMVLEYYKGVSL